MFRLRGGKLRQQSLGVEPLEPRCTPAGDVSVVLSGNTLVLNGDAQDNDVLVQYVEVGQMVFYQVVPGQNGTTLNGDSSPLLFDAESVDNLDIRLNQGNDSLEISRLGTASFFLSGNLLVDLGSGDDALTLGDLDIGGSTTILGRQGNDSLLLDGTSNFAGPVLLDLAQGNDNLGPVVPSSYTGATFNKSLTILTGAGNDFITLGRSGFATTVSGTLSIQTGAGDDEVFLVADTIKKLVIDTAQGNDRVIIYSSTIQSSATVLLGAGEDFLDPFMNTFNGPVLYDGGPGTDVFLHPPNSNTYPPSQPPVVNSFP
ncbi:hypothetical protein HRbin36_00703 [bacterium HR36]|nr:hypothetical protein HRbin36_00703 [bacterium HR36]